jgi:hypothetical protein
MAALRKSSNKPMPSFLHKVITIGIATALGGISFITHPEYVAAQEDHHSPKNTTTPQPSDRQQLQLTNTLNTSKSQHSQLKNL